MKVSESLIINLMGLFYFSLKYFRKISSTTQDIDLSFRAAILYNFSKVEGFNLIEIRASFFSSIPIIFPKYTKNYDIVRHRYFL